MKEKMSIKCCYKILCLISVLFLVVTSAYTFDNPHLHNETTNTISDKCFYRLESECPTNGCSCKSMTLSNNITESIAIYCCNINNSNALERGLECANFSSSVSHIHIRNATLNYFNASEVRWRMLKSLTVTDGKINRVKGQFLMMTPITCLNFSNNSLLEIEHNSLIRLAQLSTLDLSNNNLTRLPALNIINGREFWLDISGTISLMCSEIQQNINKTGESQIHFNREDQTLCSTNFTWHWFNTTEKVPLMQVKYLDSLQKECPKGDDWQCKCHFNRLEIIGGKLPIFSVNVDCTNTRLNSLPQRLPRNTISLDVSYNNITALDELIINPLYDGIREFLADYNNISSINILEGSKFIDRYQTLSLRYNKIKSLPTYILATANEKNTYNNIIINRFGGNELHCDCNTAKFLKVWIQTKIADYDEIFCENVREKVIDLESGKMCVYPGDWTDYIFYIITTEIFLIFCLIAKVSYDYWVFKTAGYLPWPANKMPKLPCDWLCET